MAGSTWASHDMVYDYTFHMYIAKQEGIIQYKERCISSLTTISCFTQLNASQGCCQGWGLYMSEISYAVFAGRCSISECAVSQSVTAASHAAAVLCIQRLHFIESKHA